MAVSQNKKDIKTRLKRDVAQGLAVVARCPTEMTREKIRNEGGKYRRKYFARNVSTVFTSDKVTPLKETRRIHSYVEGYVFVDCPRKGTMKKMYHITHHFRTTALQRKLYDWAR